MFWILQTSPRNAIMMHTTVGSLQTGRFCVAVRLAVIPPAPNLCHRSRSLLLFPASLRLLTFCLCFSFFPSTSVYFQNDFRNHSTFLSFHITFWMKIKGCFLRQGFPQLTVACERVSYRTKEPNLVSDSEIHQIVTRIPKVREGKCTKRTQEHYRRKHFRVECRETKKHPK